MSKYVGLVECLCVHVSLSTEPPIELHNGSNDIRHIDMSCKHHRSNRYGNIRQYWLRWRFRRDWLRENAVAGGITER